MDEDSDTLDLAFSRWSSPAVVATLAGVLGVLTGAAVPVSYTHLTLPTKRIV